MHKKYTSPDNEHEVKLLFEGEIRYGPNYYKLKIDDKIIPDKIFGDKLFWSSDSRFLAVEEWLTTVYREGPITRLLLIDLVSNKAAAFKIIYEGFLHDVRFGDDVVTYQKKYFGFGDIMEAEVSYKDIKNWKRL